MVYKNIYQYLYHGGHVWVKLSRTGMKPATPAIPCVWNILFFGLTMVVFLSFKCQLNCPPLLTHRLGLLHLELSILTVVTPSQLSPLLHSIFFETHS